MTLCARLGSVAFFVSVACLSLSGQAPAGQQFEVATVRPSASFDPADIKVGVHIDGAQVHIVALTLKEYADIAYRVKPSRISGPDWTGSDRYDISATLPEGSKPSQIPDMLQALLADRFHLKLHHDQKEFAVFALMQGKPPLKLKEEPPAPADDKNEPQEGVNVQGGGSRAGVALNLGHGSSFSFANNRFEAAKMTMAQVANELERFAGRPIVDMTSLTGRYSFGVDFTPEDYRAMLIRSAIAAGVSLPPQALHALDGSSDSALGEALEQVGLKLQPRKAPLDVLVIDDALKTPVAN